MGIEKKNETKSCLHGQVVESNIMYDEATYLAFLQGYLVIRGEGLAIEYDASLSGVGIVVNRENFLKLYLFF